MMQLNFTLPVAGPSPAEFDQTPQKCQAENDNIKLVVFVVDDDGEIVNVRNATELKLRLLAPDSTTIDRAAALYTNGIDGALQYTTVLADLKQAGLYRLQAKYTIAGKTQTTRWGQFRVGANVDES